MRLQNVEIIIMQKKIKYKLIVIKNEFYLWRFSYFRRNYL